MLRASPPLQPRSSQHNCNPQQRQRKLRHRQLRQQQPPKDRLHTQLEHQQQHPKSTHEHSLPVYKRSSMFTSGLQGRLFRDSTLGAASARRCRLQGAIEARQKRDRALNSAVEARVREVRRLENRLKRRVLKREARLAAKRARAAAEIQRHARGIACRRALALVFASNAASRIQRRWLLCRRIWDARMARIAEVDAQRVARARARSRAATIINHRARVFVGLVRKQSVVAAELAEQLTRVARAANVVQRAWRTAQQRRLAWAAGKKIQAIKFAKAALPIQRAFRRWYWKKLAADAMTRRRRNARTKLRAWCDGWSRHRRRTRARKACATVVRERRKEIMARARAMAERGVRAARNAASVPAQSTSRDIRLLAQRAALTAGKVLLLPALEQDAEDDSTAHSALAPGIVQSVRVADKAKGRAQRFAERKRLYEANRQKQEKVIHDVMKRLLSPRTALGAKNDGATKSVAKIRSVHTNNSDSEYSDDEDFEDGDNTTENTKQSPSRRERQQSLENMETHAVAAAAVAATLAAERGQSERHCREAAEKAAASVRKDHADKKEIMRKQWLQNQNAELGAQRHTYSNIVAALSPEKRSEREAKKAAADLAARRPSSLVRDTHDKVAKLERQRTIMSEKRSTPSGFAFQQTAAGKRHTSLRWETNQKYAAASRRTVTQRRETAAAVKRKTQLLEPKAMLTGQ